MIGDNEYICCPECGHLLFKEEQVFAIKKVYANTPRRELSYKKEAQTVIKCARCGTEVDVEL